jgi:hypothetical protein
VRILATRRVDMFSTLYICVAGVLQLASIVFSIHLCVLGFLCLLSFFHSLKCYFIVQVCVNLHLSTFPR